MTEQIKRMGRILTITTAMLATFSVFSQGEVLATAGITNPESIEADCITTDQGSFVLVPFDGKVGVFESECLTELRFMNYDQLRAAFNGGEQLPARYQVGAGYVDQVEESESKINATKASEVDRGSGVLSVDSYLNTIVESYYKDATSENSYFITYLGEVVRISFFNDSSLGLVYSVNRSSSDLESLDYIGFEDVVYTGYTGLATSVLSGADAVFSSDDGWSVLHFVNKKPGEYKVYLTNKKGLLVSEYDSVKIGFSEGGFDFDIGRMRSVVARDFKDKLVQSVSEVRASTSSR